MSASHCDDDFSSSMSLFQITESLRDFAERMRPVDDRRDFACLYELRQVGQVFFAAFRIQGAECLAHERR